MAIDQGAGVLATSAIATGILGVAAAPPLSLADFGWFAAFAGLGILGKHASNAAQERGVAKKAGVPKADWPNMDIVAFAYDAMTAPLLGTIGWVVAYYSVMVMWKVPLDKSVLSIAAMVSGYIGAEWVRFMWAQIQGIVSKRTGVAP